MLPERECRTLHDTGQERRYAVQLRSGGDGQRWPDAVLESQHGRRAFEIELAPKGTQRLRAIITGYELGQYDDVTFLVKSGPLGRRIAELHRAVPNFLGQLPSPVHVEPWLGLRAYATVARNATCRHRGRERRRGAVAGVRGPSPVSLASALTTKSQHDEALSPAGGREQSCASAATARSLPDASRGSAVLVMSSYEENAAGVPLWSPLLTSGEIAELLAVPRSSVYEYARRRNDPLPSLQIGRHRRFERAAVERWLAGHCSVR